MQLRLNEDGVLLSFRIFSYSDWIPAIGRKSLYSVRIWENTEQKKTPYTGMFILSLTFKSSGFPVEVILLMIQKCTGQWYAVSLDNCYTTPELTTALLQLKTSCYGTLNMEWWYTSAEMKRWRRNQKSEDCYILSEIYAREFIDFGKTSRSPAKLAWTWCWETCQIVTYIIPYYTILNWEVSKGIKSFRIVYWNFILSLLYYLIVNQSKQ